jgi:HK97 family phage major capsid protein
VKQVAGQARQPIQGAIPEAVWTEACANLNELDLSFSKVEVDGFRCGGYFRICNCTLEDSDEDLVAILTEALGQAIGLALDKAILYGTGTKMPVGIVTALDAVANKPNIVTIANTYHGKDLLAQIVLASAKAKGKYSRGEKMWAMNETTYTKLLAEFIAVDGSGAYVSMLNGRMPVVGGEIIVLDFIPDDNIIGGYYDLYLLAERAGTRIRTSDQAFFIEDQTGFAGTARYDGKVLVNNAFVAIGINGATPDPDDVTFAQDGANL